MGINRVIQIAQKKCFRMKENIHKIERLGQAKLWSALDVALISFSIIPEGNDELLKVF